MTRKMADVQIAMSVLLLKASKTRFLSTGDVLFGFYDAQIRSFYIVEIHKCYRYFKP